MKNKFICFAVNTLKQAEETIQEANKNNIKPIIFIKYYIVKGFGIDWIKTLQLLLASSFPQNSFKLYVDANTDYGLSIELISIKIEKLATLIKAIMLFFKCQDMDITIKAFLFGSLIKLETLKIKHLVLFH